MSKYLNITKNELIALLDVSDSMMAMTGSGNSDFDAEAQKGKKAIDAILKRAGLERQKYINHEISVGNIR